MAKTWIAHAVDEKGAAGRRWLRSQEHDSNQPTRRMSNGNQAKAEFSINNGALIVHMSERRTVQVLEVDSKSTNPMWVGDGKTKIRAAFTRVPTGCHGQSFGIQKFDIVIDPTKNPESRVTLQIHDFQLENSRSTTQISPLTYVEHIPRVQKILRSLGQIGRQDRRPSVYGSEAPSSPRRSQAGDLVSPSSSDGNFATQASFATQLPRTDIKLNATVAPETQLETEPPMREEIKKVIDPHTNEEPSKNSNALIAMALALPRKAAATNIVAVKNVTTIKSHAEDEVTKHLDQGVPSKRFSELLFQTVQGDLPEDLASVSKEAIAQSSRSPGLIWALPPDELPKTSANDLKVLGDNEKDNSQRKLVEPNTQHTQIGVNAKSEMGGSCLAEDPWEAMRKTQKINHRFFEFPEESEEVWATPNLSKSGLQESRASLNEEKSSSRAIEQRLEGNSNTTIYGSAPPRNNPSGKNAPNSDLVSEEDSDASAAERQLGYSDVKKINVRNVRSQEREMLDNTANETAVSAIETEEQGATTDYAMSGGSRSRETSIATEWPRQDPKSSKRLPFSHEVSQTHEVKSSTSLPRSSFDEVSWPSSPEQDQLVVGEPNNGDPDEMVSLVPESSIPGSSLVVGKSLCSLDKYDVSNYVQVVHSNLTAEEDEEEEEMEIAEPSALDQGKFMSAEIVAQSIETAPSPPAPSTTPWEPEVVEVERTPHLQTLRPNFIPQANNFDISSDSVVPGTAEEENRWDEVRHILPATDHLEFPNIKRTIPSSKSGAQDDTNSVKRQRVMSPTLASTENSTKFDEQSSSFKYPKLQPRRGSSTRSPDSQSRALSANLLRIEKETFPSQSLPSDRKLTSSFSSPEQLDDNERGNGIVLLQDYNKDTDMDQECSRPEAVGTTEESGILENSTSISSSSKPLAAEKGPMNIAASEPANVRAESVSVKHTSLQAELSISPPPPKRMAGARNLPVTFTPGTQSPVDLEELKKSYRREFLQGHTATRQPIASPDRVFENSIQDEPATQESGLAKETKVETLSKTQAAHKQVVIAAHSYENESESTEDSDSYMANNQGEQVSLSSEQHANIYERYQLAYPSFQKSLHAFIRACVCIEWLTSQHLMPMLWDDFVHKHCHEYAIYVSQNRNPLSAIKWYNDHDNFTCNKRVLQRDNLNEVFALDPIETEKVREKFRRGTNQKSNPATEGIKQLQQPSTSPVIQPSPSLNSSASKSVTGKRRLLPWDSSPQSSANDTVPTSHSKRRRYEEQDEPSNEPRITPYLTGLKSNHRERQVGGEFRPRQASPELGSWRSSIPRPRSSSGVDTREVTARQLDTSSRIPSTTPLPARSSILDSTRPPQSSTSENVRKSTSRSGSRGPSLTAESVAEIAKKWYKNPNRRRTIINLAEGESG